MAKQGKEDNHYKRWLHNRSFVSMLPGSHCDWMLTGAFYAAVHAVESLVAHDSLPNHTSHEGRNRTLKNTNRYRKIWKHYHVLYNASLTTRYHCDPNSWIPLEEIKEKLILKELYPLEKSVLKLTDREEELPKIKFAGDTEDAA